MGEFRKYRPYYACNALRFNGYPFEYGDGYQKPNARTRVPNFQDISGRWIYWLKNLNARNLTYNDQTSAATTISGIPNQWITYGKAITGNYQIFRDLTPVATADKLENYNISDYQINQIGITYCTRSAFVAEDVNKMMYSMSIFNNSVDVYELNGNASDPSNPGNPVWSPNTFYRLVDDNYILTEQEPSDWNDVIGDGYGYNTYYTLTPAEDIEVSCIKFRGYLGADNSSDQGYGSATATETRLPGEPSSSGKDTLVIYALMLSYFLDEPVTIHPGDSYLLALSLETSQF